MPGSLRAFLGTHGPGPAFLPFAKITQQITSQTGQGSTSPAREARVFLGNGAAQSIPICSPPATLPFPGRDREADQRTSESPVGQGGSETDFSRHSLVTPWGLTPARHLCRPPRERQRGEGRPGSLNQRHSPPPLVLRQQAPLSPRV